MGRGSVMSATGTPERELRCDVAVSDQPSLSGAERSPRNRDAPAAKAIATANETIKSFPAV